MLFGIHQMRANVIFDDFGHQARHGPPHPGDKTHDPLAASLVIKRALHGLNLAPDTAHARQQLLFFSDRMRHPRRLP